MIYSILWYAVPAIACNGATPILYKDDGGSTTGSGGGC